MFNNCGDLLEQYKGRLEILADTTAEQATIESREAEHQRGGTRAEQAEILSEYEYGAEPLTGGEPGDERRHTGEEAAPPPVGTLRSWSALSPRTS